MRLDRVIAVRTGKTVYRDGENCIKVFAGDYSADEVLNEALNQARAECAGLNVPRVRSVMQTEGRWAISSDYIPGKSLGVLMKEYPEKRDEFLSLFVGVQRLIHSVSPVLTGTKEKIKRKILRAEIGEALREDLLFRFETMPQGKALCHGDFNPTNVVLRQDGIPFIVDWSHASVGDPSADAARTRLYFLLSGDGRAAREYISLYCRQSGTEEEEIGKWMPFVAAALSVDANADNRVILLSRLAEDRWE
ncbi:MAG: aminoglycoside phosphotransferase family protein [Candidatus Borkfalkiaceae bacterium]|nr:aminoglycoside phosphotransferase family protein [Christensenellaceae bacterium]